MAKGSFGKRPNYSISTSVFIRKGKYKQGPSFGLWLNDGKGPMARGTVKDDYLTELAEFLQKAADNDFGVSFALFKNKDKKRDEDEEEEEEEEEEDEPTEKGSKKSSKKGSKKSGGKSGEKGSKKKSDWDFD